MFRFLRDLAAAAACLAAGSGLAQDASIGLGSAVISVDPQFCVIESSSALARNVFDALVNQDDHQQLVLDSRRAGRRSMRRPGSSSCATAADPHQRPGAAARQQPGPHAVSAWQRRPSLG
ncbi:MAG: hypothetical protein FJX57_09135 [Alphaproteobacteria bacterium]|nr:hypothetical protein [Alphaproteobacteria bacterium]